MTADKLVLIDLSSIARPIYETQIDPQRTSVEIVAKVRALASAHAHVAIACDSRTSFRRDLDPTYKAQRPETPAVYLHELALAVETLRGDGFPVWQAEGFEADDIIATAIRMNFDWSDSAANMTLIVSADKDLFQLVNTRVEQFRPANGPTVAKTFDADAVFLRYGVHPHQMLDYIALVGDTSDNIRGADGIGEKKATGLLKQFGNLDDIMAALENPSVNFTPSTRKSLTEFKPRIELVRSLLRLRTDAPIPFEEILKPRVPVDVATFSGPEPDEESSGPYTKPDDDIEFAMPTLSEAVQSLPEEQAVKVEQAVDSIREVAARQNGQTSLVRVDPIRVEWALQFEPSSISELKDVADILFKSRIFSAWGSPHAVFAIIQAGRELGMKTQQSLRAFHNIDNKPAMAADLIRGLVLSSGKCDYFDIIERERDHATFETLRKGRTKPVMLTFTLEDGRKAWAKDDKAWNASGWGKNPADMCVARAGAKLARLVYPDVVHGLYSPEEMEGA
jgi:5'-3' exonuclease